MGNRINIAELLKDCPKGMELDCTMFEGVEFDGIVDNKYTPIRCRIKNPDGGYNVYFFTKHGYWNDDCKAKCVIFPKGKTTWEGFQRPFKDGDIVASNSGSQVFIFKEYVREENNYAYCYVFLKGDGTVDFECDSYFISRLATEEEKQKLFQAIKDNGYEWNPESKTLEKLMESKEDTNEDIVMSGIYFDREYYADEVELHLGNYEIEIRNGKTYAVYKNQETKISKPIFKVGDKIKHKDTVLTIITVQTNSYIVEDEPDNFGLLMFSQQYKWELINDPKFKVGDKIKSKNLDIINPIEITAVTPRMYTFTNGSFQYVEIIDKNYELVSSKFNISTLKPFDKVLVRCSTLEKWRIQLFEKYDKTYQHPFVCIGCNKYKQCIPYEGNEYLLDSTDDCDEYFKTWK